jgi:hypothetical protein
MEPILYLDFDRTIFRTDDLFDALKLGGVDIHTLVCETAPFCENELSQFIYPDALCFLRQYSGERHLISSYTHRTTLKPSNEAFQQKKVVASGIVPLFTKVHIIGEDKGPYIARKFGRDATGIFVDDLTDHLWSVTQRCPGITCIHIDRAGIGGWDRARTIRSFDELQKLIDASTFD